MSLSYASFAQTSIDAVTCNAIVKEGIDYSGAGPYMEIYGPLTGYSESVKSALVQKGYNIINEKPTNGDYLDIDVRSAVHDVQTPGDRNKTRYCFSTVTISSEQNPALELKDGQFLIKSPLAQRSLHGKSGLFRGCDAILNAVTESIPDCVAK